MASNPSHSPPSSPASEEDLSHGKAWPDEDESDILQSRNKRKQIQEHDANTLNASDGASDTDTGMYPPMNGDEGETRRIEENLRRWEVNERQRRKAARESSHNLPTSSLVSHVTRRATLLWSGNKARHSSHHGLGNHAALKSQESVDNLPLEYITASPAASPTSERSLSDPFANPSEPSSPFAISQQRTSLLTPSLDPVPSTSFKDTASTSTISHDSAALSVPTSRNPQPPPPKPLGLPPPRPPPTPINARPEAIPSPTTNNNSLEEDIKESRWWHEWLCGCGEGADRGGDSQAGRTNPFE